MSDITKKIFSIEPAKDDVLPAVGVTSAATDLRPTPPEDVPSFVTRTQTRPVVHIEPAGTGWIAWTGLAFTFIWILGVGLLFASELISGETGLLDLTGLVVLLALPAALITLLWIALRKMVAVINLNAQMSTAAKALISPESEALGRTRTLADGIRAEISKVNSQLADTVTALQGVQTAVTRESTALDAAGLQLVSRSEDVGRNLTLQRQALESIAGAFDAKMESLSVQIAETGRELEATSETAGDRILTATTSMANATAKLSETSDTTDRVLSERITALGDISTNVELTSGALGRNLSKSVEDLTSVQTDLVEKTSAIDTGNLATRDNLQNLEATLGAGQALLGKFHEAANMRDAAIGKLYETLTEQLSRAEDSTLASQGRTARMVEGNLAQMRRDFARMETELQTLQTKINNLRDTTEELPLSNGAGQRLSLKPLDSDFPPVEPPSESIQVVKKIEEDVLSEPLNLGADMQLDNPDDDLTAYDPDVLRRPGQDAPVKSGFGRTRNKPDADSGWHWRDMLGGLERPDMIVEKDAGPTSGSAETNLANAETVEIIEQLSAIQLSPAAIVDDGTIIDATQARINGGEAGLARTVEEKLADPVAHLRAKMDEDGGLAIDVAHFAAEFAEKVGSTPPSAPALRAVFGSPKGRAYLLCAAALTR